MKYVAHWFIATVVSVLFLGFGTSWVFGQSPEAALAYLEELEKPVFREGHQLPALSHWRFLSPEVAKALADGWGYALPFRVRPDFIEQLDNPESEPGRIVRLVRDEPDRYVLQVVVAPARAFERGLRYEDMPEGTFYRDVEGRLVEGEYHFSPLAPNSAFVRIGEFYADMIEKIEDYAPVSIILNGGEYGLKKQQFVPRSIAEQDPRVIEEWKHDGRSWLEFMSAHKARQERIVRSALLRAAPEAMYIHYSEVGGGHPRRYMMTDWEDRDFLYRPGVSDFASPPLYFRHANSGFTGPRDMISQLLNARAQELAMGAQHAYYWFSAGWYRRDPDMIADTDLYEGFLKMCYVAGGIGGVAGYFGAAPDRDPPEKSLPQFLALGRAHALFSHLDTFLANSRLLSGPGQHASSRDLPAYEFPTGDGNKRVIVRQGNGTEQWMIGVWAADGREAEVEVEVGQIGKLTLEASREANIYFVEKKDGEYSKQRMTDLASF